MAVERKVVGRERHVGVEQQLQAPLGRPIEVARRARPEEPVVHEGEPRAGVAGAGEELGAGRDARRDRAHLVGPGDLQTARRVVVEGGRAQELVEMVDEFRD